MPLDELLTVEYRRVSGWPKYKVGTDGSVWSSNRNTMATVVANGWHLLIGGKDKDGYRRVILCHNGKRKYVRVNVLVLTTFKGPPPADMVHPTAAHENGVKDDNSLSNLFWKTQKDNIADKIKHGTAQIGEKHPQSLLTDVKVRRIRAMRKAGNKWREIAEHFGEKLVTVYAAGAGKNWPHI